MKKHWTQPVMECEQFVANEYVAACFYVCCYMHDDRIAMEEIFYDLNNNNVYDEGDTPAFQECKTSTNYQCHKFFVISGLPESGPSPTPNLKVITDKTHYVDGVHTDIKYVANPFHFTASTTYNGQAAVHQDHFCNLDYDSIGNHGQVQPYEDPNVSG